MSSWVHFTKMELTTEQRKLIDIEHLVDALFPSGQDSLFEEAALAQKMTKEEVATVWARRREKCNNRLKILLKMLQRREDGELNFFHWDGSCRKDEKFIHSYLGEFEFDGEGPSYPGMLSIVFPSMFPPPDKGIALRNIYGVNMVVSDENRGLKGTIPAIFHKRSKHMICTWNFPQKGPHRSGKALGAFSSVENTEFNRDSAYLGLCSKILEVQGLRPSIRIISLGHGYFSFPPSKEVMDCVNTLWDSLAEESAGKESTEVTASV